MCLFSHYDPKTNKIISIPGLNFFLFLYETLHFCKFEDADLTIVFSSKFQPKITQIRHFQFMTLFELNLTSLKAKLQLISPNFVFAILFYVYFFKAIFIFHTIIFTKIFVFFEIAVKLRKVRNNLFE